MKKKIIIVQSVVIAILIVALSVMVMNPYGISNYIVKSSEPTKKIYLEFGDTFSGVEMTDVNGKMIDDLGGSERYTVVMYLSSSCSSCIESLSDFNRFSRVFGSGLNYVILWYDEIPTYSLEKFLIDESVNYSLKQKTKISTSTPTYFILDKDNVIVYRDVNRVNMIEKLIELDLVSRETLIENANKYIIDNYFDSDSDSTTNKIVYFYMPGCQDCEKADTILSSSSVLEEFECVYIYKYDTTDSSKIVDKDKLFVDVYDIDWYPSFLVLTDDTYRIIGEVPSENLIEELTK